MQLDNRNDIRLVNYGRGSEKRRMRLVEQHIIKSNNKYYKELKNLCRLSKNLYNATLYEIRQYFFENKKYLSYPLIDRKFKKNNNIDYKSLPSQTAQQTMRAVDSSFRSFFKLLNMKNKGLYNKSINIPYYLKKDGYFTLIYTGQQLGKKLLNGVIRLPLTNIEFHSNKKNIKQVRFIPSNNYIIMEVVYEVKESEIKEDNDRYCGIDLGLNNLATITSNVSKPYIINGRPIKSINQYYNKKKAYLQSKLKDQKTSKRIQSLTLKRNNKINDYFHKTSSYIVNQLVFNSINTIIIGHNKDWKQDINMGSKNNQSFTSVPHTKLINQLKYKCRLVGINVICREESYTSKSSFLDCDSIPNLKDDKISFSGERIKRGLYKSGSGRLINADVNGSYNIMRKEVGDVVLPADRGFVFNPIKISF